MIFEGSYWDLIDKGVELSNLSNMVNHHNFKDFSIRSGNDVLKSYPVTKKETSEIVRCFLKRLINDRRTKTPWRPLHVVVFVDMNSEYNNWHVPTYRIITTYFPEGSLLDSVTPSFETKRPPYAVVK